MFSPKKKGSIPEGGELLKTFGTRREWALYKTGVSGSWLSLKLILVVGTAPKANYRLFWDGDRIGKNHDSAMLLEHRSVVAVDILDYLAANFKTWDSGAKTERTSEGVVPENAPKIGELKNIDGVDWLVFDTVSAGPNNRGVKIIAAERVAGRANYSLEWNGKRFIRDKNFSRLAERIELLAAAEGFMDGYEESKEVKPELHSALMEESDNMREEGTPKVEWTKLGTVGVVADLERDLLVKEVEEGLEVRLSTSDPDEPTTTCFIAKQVHDGLFVEGVLYNSLKRNTPEVWLKAQELLRQYFRARDFY